MNKYIYIVLIIIMNSTCHSKDEKEINNLDEIELRGNVSFIQQRVYSAIEINGEIIRGSDTIFNFDEDIASPVLLSRYPTSINLYKGSFDINFNNGYITKIMYYDNNLIPGKLREESSIIYEYDSNNQIKKEILIFDSKVYRSSFYEYINNIKVEKSIYESNTSDTNYSVIYKNTRGNDSLKKLNGDLNGNYGSYEIYNYDENNLLVNQSTYFGSNLYSQKYINYEINSIHERYYKNNTLINTSIIFIDSVNNKITKIVDLKNEDGKTETHAFIYNENNDIVKEVKTNNFDNNVWTIEYDYTYDKNNNWIKRITKSSPFSSMTPLIYITERRIEYFE